MELKERILEWARAIGAVAAGIAPAGPMPEEQARVEDWLAGGYGANLSYLARPDERRSNASRLFDGARSVVCVAFGYNSPLPYSTEVPAETGRGWVSRYAWGEDYHGRVTGALAWLSEMIGRVTGETTHSRLLCDSGPVLEKALAARAGLGWIGKHSLLIHPRFGSWIFLGEIVTSVEIEPDVPIEDRCGDCRRCLDACPTGALVAPRVLDARLCISYHTTGVRDPLPEGLVPRLGRHLFGCDICQDVCPWNEKAPREAPAYFHPRDGLFHPDLAALRSLDADRLKKLVMGGPMRWLGVEGFRRNLDAVARNAGGRCGG